MRAAAERDRGCGALEVQKKVAIRVTRTQMRLRRRLYMVRMMARACAIGFTVGRRRKSEGCRLVSGFVELCGCTKGVTVLLYHTNFRPITSSAVASSPRRPRCRAAARHEPINAIFSIKRLE